MACAQLKLKNDLDAGTLALSRDVRRHAVAFCKYNIGDGNCQSAYPSQRSRSPLSGDPARERGDSSPAGN